MSQASFSFLFFKSIIFSDVVLFTSIKSIKSQLKINYFVFIIVLFVVIVVFISFNYFIRVHDQITFRRKNFN